MKKIEITKTITEVVGYEANDGTRFNNMEACKEYEKSLKGVLSEEFNRMTLVDKDACCIDELGLSCDNILRLFHPNDTHDIAMLNSCIKNLYDCSGNEFKANHIGKYVVMVSDCESYYGWCFKTTDELINNYVTNINQLIEEAENGKEN